MLRKSRQRRCRLRAERLPGNRRCEASAKFDIGNEGKIAREGDDRRKVADKAANRDGKRAAEGDDRRKITREKVLADDVERADENWGEGVDAAVVRAAVGQLAVGAGTADVASEIDVIGWPRGKREKPGLEITAHPGKRATWGNAGSATPLLDHSGATSVCCSGKG